MSATTQEHLPVQNIVSDLAILKDGSVAMVLQTSAVNFDLLSEREQLAIIDAFAGLLNSLSFAIQIVIRSKRLDISNYLGKVDQAMEKQQNPLLRTLMEHYKNFVQTTIQENDVLDKQFYVVIYVSYFEIGVLKNSNKDMSKALTILIPRRDHIVRQLARIGLKATQLSTEKLVELFYDIYNEPEEVPVVISETLPTQPQNIPLTPAVQKPVVPAYVPPPPSIPPAVMSNRPIPQVPMNTQTFQQTMAPQQAYHMRNSPFVVEELPDDFNGGAIKR